MRRRSRSATAHEILLGRATAYSLIDFLPLLLTQRLQHPPLLCFPPFSLGTLVSLTFEALRFALLLCAGSCCAIAGGILLLLGGWRRVEGSLRLIGCCAEGVAACAIEIGCVWS